MTSYPPPPQEPNNEPDPSSTPYPSYSSYPAPDGAMPAYPQGAGQQEPPAEQPPSIVRAVLLMRIGAGISLVSILIGLLTIGSVKDNIKQKLIDNGTYTQTDFNTAYHILVISTIVGGIIGVALWLWMAQTNGNGRKWARIVATVFGALGILSAITTLAQGQETAIGMILSVIIALDAIVILVLLWRGESTAYYNARSRRQLV